MVTPMQSQTESEAPPHDPPALSVVAAPRRSKGGWLIAGAILLVFAGIFTYGILSRLWNGATVRTETAQMAVPSVSVISPQASASSQEIVLPGNMQPFMSAPIYSRTNGYLKRWHADIGAHVRKGQLLAEIETPEVDQQLQQARSNLATAQANLKLAEITMNRYEGLLVTHAVAQQDVDNTVGTYNANKAIVEANQANVKQFETLQSFQRIYAPFDGIVTARNTDIGALIASGNSGGVKTDLFHISQPGKLRVYVNVPEQYSQAATPGLTAELTLAEFPGRRFQGKLVRTSNAINYATRTLLAEIDVDNPSGELLSGAYTEGDQIEIVSGLKGDESVIVNPPDSIVSGQKVQVVQPAATGGAQ